MTSLDLDNNLDLGLWQTRSQSRQKRKMYTGSFSSAISRSFAAVLFWFLDGVGSGWASFALLPR